MNSVIIDPRCVAEYRGRRGAGRDWDFLTLVTWNKRPGGHLCSGSWALGLSPLLAPGGMPESPASWGLWQIASPPIQVSPVLQGHVLQRQSSLVCFFREVGVQNCSFQTPNWILLLALGLGLWGWGSGAGQGHHPSSHREARRTRSCFKSMKHLDWYPRLPGSFTGFTVPTEQEISDGDGADPFGATLWAPTGPMAGHLPSTTGRAPCRQGHGQSWTLNPPGGSQRGSHGASWRTDILVSLSFISQSPVLCLPAQLSSDLP